MTEEQLKNAYSLYTCLWKMVKDYHNAKTDKEWGALADKASVLVEQHGDIIRPLVLDTLELIERSSK